MLREPPSFRAVTGDTEKSVWVKLTPDVCYLGEWGTASSGIRSGSLLLPGSQERRRRTRLCTLLAFLVQIRHKSYSGREGSSIVKQRRSQNASVFCGEWVHPVDTGETVTALDQVTAKPEISPWEDLGGLTMGGVGQPSDGLLDHLTLGQE